MTAVIGAPSVTPLRSPEVNSGTSASRRAVAYSPLPGARRCMKRMSASKSTRAPAGTPSSVMPIAAACDWPNISRRRHSP